MLKIIVSLSKLSLINLGTVCAIEKTEFRAIIVCLRYDVNH